jgi:hypothetical protein
MVEREFKVGDRVVLAGHAVRWAQPLRGYAEKGKRATVLSVFVPLGCFSPVIKVRFDLRRYARSDSGEEYFAARDLVLAND